LPGEAPSAAIRAIARRAADRHASEQYMRGRLPGVWAIGVPQWQRGPAGRCGANVAPSCILGMQRSVPLVGQRSGRRARV